MLTFYERALVWPTRSIWPTWSMPLNCGLHSPPVSSNLIAQWLYQTFIIITWAMCSCGFDRCQERRMRKIMIPLWQFTQFNRSERGLRTVSEHPKKNGPKGKLQRLHPLWWERRRRANWDEPSYCGPRCWGSAADPQQQARGAFGVPGWLRVVTCKPDPRAEHQVRQEKEKLHKLQRL